MVPRRKWVWRRNAEKRRQGPGEKSRKAQESLARSSAPSPTFQGLHLVQGRSMLEGTAPALHVHSVPRVTQLPRASVTLEAAWPRPPAPSCTLYPDTLAGRGGVAWQQGSDRIGRARSRDRAPGSGAPTPPPPRRKWSHLPPPASQPRLSSASAPPLLGPWPPTRTARAPAPALPRAPRCRTRASCGTSSRGAADRAGERGQASPSFGVSPGPSPSCPTARSPAWRPGPPACSVPPPLTSSPPPGTSRSAERRSGGSASVLLPRKRGLCSGTRVSWGRLFS